MIKESGGKSGGLEYGGGKEKGGGKVEGHVSTFEILLPEEDTKVRYSAVSALFPISRSVGLSGAGYQKRQKPITPLSAYSRRKY